MAKQGLNEQLDRIVDAILAQPGTALPHMVAKLDQLARVAASLRGLPRETFKEHVKADLERRAAMASQAVKPIPEGFHTLTPYLIVPRAAQFIQFVQNAFGAVELFRVKRPGSNLLMHALVCINDSMIELADAIAEFPPTPAALHLYVPDADAVYERALQNGALSLHSPVDQPYGDHEASVKDEFGNRWYIATPLGGAPVPKGLRTVTPYLHPSGAGSLIAFLQDAFGAEEIARHQSPDGTIVHAEVRIGDSILEMGEAHGEVQPMPCTLHLYVHDTDALYARALRAGATSIETPQDKPYGDRSAGVMDPCGNRWFIATHIKDVQF
jgi:PhnB protein